MPRKITYAQLTAQWDWIGFIPANCWIWHKGQRVKDIRQGVVTLSTRGDWTRSVQATPDMVFDVLRDR